MQPQATQTPPATEPKPVPTSDPADAAPAAGPAAAPTDGPAKPAKVGYSKRPLWQWVLIYVVLAAIVYGLVYYFFLRDSGSTLGY